jgi:hypothetical protein
LFQLDGGLSQLADINSAANIYYDPSLDGNAYLQGRSWAFGSGGGQLLAAVPEPGSAALWLGGMALFSLRRLRAQRRA